MEKILVFPIGNTQAVRCCEVFLHNGRIPLVDHPTPDATHLLLDIPSFHADGSLRCGGNIEHYLRMLPESITVIGGNLEHPALEGYRKMDLLRDPVYLAENAAITAYCALQVAAEKLPVIFSGLDTLIIGWGRIGKCLGMLLRSLGAKVTVAARKESDRAMIRALGYGAAEPTNLDSLLQSCRLVFNTAPQTVLTRQQLEKCRDCLKIDLASVKGIEGEDVIWARGLPGVCAPESSGKLIGETILRLHREGSV